MMTVAPLPDGLTVRRLEQLGPGELEALERYGREALGEAALDRWQLPVVAAFGFLFVASEAGEIAGSAQVIRCRHEGDLYMDGFYMREQCRGRGLGAALLATVLRELAALGFARLLVTVDPENKAALRLYSGRGFATAAALPKFYGAGSDRLLLAVKLADQPDRTAADSGGCEAKSGSCG